MSHQLEVSHHSTRPAKGLTLTGVRDRRPSLHHLGLYKAGGFRWVGRCFLGEDSVCEKSSSILPLLGDGGGGMGLRLVQTGMRLNKPWQCLHNGEMDPSLPIWCPPSRPDATGAQSQERIRTLPSTLPGPSGARVGALESKVSREAAGLLETRKQAPLGTEEGVAGASCWQSAWRYQGTPTACQSCLTS